ncbi:hypothetical protein D3C80_1055150 [compost metagenome]
MPGRRLVRSEAVDHRIIQAVTDAQQSRRQQVTQVALYAPAQGQHRQDDKARKQARRPIGIAFDHPAGDQQPAADRRAHEANEKQRVVQATSRCIGSLEAAQATEDRTAQADHENRPARL